VLTAFTDGCSGLRRILADAGISELPILDWFHIGMRLQHLNAHCASVAATENATQTIRDPSRKIDVGTKSRPRAD
jgi:hypothetical protein